MKLLIITQAMDEKNPVLGFFVNWVREFSKKFEKITVICLEKGEYSLPENVRVFSLGKENIKSNHSVFKKFKYTFNFYKYLWQVSNDYDAVFVHMNQEYILLAGDMWYTMRKPIYLWRNHAYGNLFTRAAVFMSHKVFYTSPQSFTARYSKAAQMPVGIDTEFFKPDPSVSRKPGSILFLGRIAPVKRVLEFIDWLDEKYKKGEVFSVTIAGEALPRDKKYEEQVREKVKQSAFANRVSFVGAVDQEGARQLYQTHETYVNLTPAGSMDKAILEAGACGMRVVVENADLKNMMEKSPQELRDFIISNHSLELLALKLEKEML